MVNRQLRTEARPIYIKENKFSLEIDSLKLEPQSKHWIWAWFHDSEVNFPFFWHVGNASWCNLKDWLHQYFEGRTKTKMGNPVVNDYDGCMRVCIQTFVLVSELRDHVTWEVMEKVLEGYRTGIDAKQPSLVWVEDKDE